MEEENTNSVKEQKFDDKDILKSVKNELEKSERDSVKSKIKELLKKRLEAEKVIRALDLEIEKIIKDFKNGI